jgi:hypothetical protein
LFFLSIETKILSDNHKNFIWIPTDLKKVLFDYGHSKFIECNSTMANLNQKLYPIESRQNIIQNDKIIPGLKFIKKILEGFQKKYWLASGGLLGIFFFLLLNCN